MIMIRFDDLESKRRALGFLAGRFAFKSWSSGEMAVPETALAHLATEGIRFSSGRSLMPQTCRKAGNSSSNSKNG